MTGMARRTACYSLAEILVALGLLVYLVLALLKPEMFA